MATRSVRYAERVIADSGLALNHLSNYQTRDPLGNLVPPNTPSFERTMAVAAPPAAPIQIASVTGTAGGRYIVCIGSGKWIDGQTAVGVIRSGTASTAGQLMLRIGIGTSFAANSFDTGSAPVAGRFSGVVEFDIGCQAGDLGAANKAGGNRSDLLRGAGAANGELADTIHSPTLLTITDGLIIAHCAVSRFSGSWSQVATSICQYDIATAKWKLVLQAADNSTGKTRTQFWTNTYWTARDKGQDRPTELWAAYVDYVSAAVATDVHVCMLLRATRPNTNSLNWTVQAIEVLRITDVAGNQHLHSAIVTPLGVVICQGHTGNGSLILLNWASPWTFPSGPAGEADGAVQNGWTTNLKFSGKRAAGVAGRRFNQYMGVAPTGKNHTDFVVCADIGHDALVKMTMPSSATEKAKFSVLLAGRGGSWAVAPYEVYGITCDDNHDPKLWVSMKVAFSSVTMPSAAPFSGAAWTSYGQDQKIIFSRDGINWSQLYANTTGVAREPKAVGNQVFFSTVAGGNTVLQALTIPAISTGRPLIVGGRSSNFATATPAITGVASGSALTNVTTTYQTPNSLSVGHTVPACPSPNAVFYARSSEASASSTIGSLSINATSDNAITMPQTRARLNFWLYVLPASDPFVSDTTAPFDNVQPDINFNFQSYTSSYAEFANTNYAADKHQGAGWTKHTVTLDYAGSTPALRRYILNLKTADVTVVAASYLISIESMSIGTINATASARLTEWPIKPIPSTAGDLSTTFADVVETTGFATQPTWTFAVVCQIPDDGPDQYTYDTRPTGRRLFHLVQASGLNTISVEYDVLNARFSFTDGTNTVTLAAAAPQQFVLGRAAQIGIAISRGPSGAMTFAAYVGGTTVYTTTATWASPATRPVKVVHADDSISAVEPHLLHSVVCDEDTALSAAQLTTFLQSHQAFTSPISEFQANPYDPRLASISMGNLTQLTFRTGNP